MIDYNKGVGTAKSANQKAKEKFKKKIDQAACSKQIEEGMAQAAATVDISLKEEKSYTGNKMTWDDAIQNFTLEKTTLQKCDPITLKGYLTHLRLFRAYMSNVHGFTRLDLASIKRQHVAGFINYMQNDIGRSMNTVNHYITSIKAFYNTLKKGKYIKENPFAEIEKVTVPEKDYASFTDEQIQLLLKQPDRKEWRGIRDFALLTFLAETGCRISEAILLEIKDITFDEEDDMPDFVTFYMTKKKKALRRVGLSEEASFALHTWLKVRSQMKLKTSWVGG